MTNPYKELEKSDIEHRFLCLCTYISMCENKKMNLANVLLTILTHKHYQKLFLDMLEFDSIYDIVKIFLEYDSNLYKSKYITRYIRNS